MNAISPFQAHLNRGYFKIAILFKLTGIEGSRLWDGCRAFSDY